MRMYDIILNKKNGKELTEDEIRFFIKGYTDGSIPDYQASALMMAICFTGMNEKETVILTDSMANSGDKVDLSVFGKLSADKHSTGGVGDKTTLIVAPIVASLGGKVAKMSGRGLGHTGGTVDKLEAIPGYRVNLSAEEFLAQVEKVGMAIIGHTGNLTPADKKLYSLRDVTATVDSIPLIASSIMSKKIAAGAQNIVLDVKVGSGAFMKTPEMAKILAENMVKIGKAFGRNTAALITNMDIPLGNNIGNSLEIVEAVKVLKGEIKNDLYKVSLSLAAEMVRLVFGVEKDKALEMAEDAVSSKKAFLKMKEWIAAQGGDIKYIDDLSLFEKAKESKEVIAENDGYIAFMDSEKIGLSAVTLGAGRNIAGEEIDYSAGIILNKKTGDYVKKGEPICTLFSSKQNLLKTAETEVLSAIVIDEIKPKEKPLIFDIIHNTK